MGGHTNKNPIQTSDVQSNFSFLLDLVLQRVGARKLKQSPIRKKKVYNEFGCHVTDLDTYFER